MRDLSDPYEADRRQQRDVRRQKSSTMLQNSSITQGGLRVASADGIRAESVPGGAPAVRVTGLQVVDGVLRITGIIEGGGTWVWTGTITNSGTFTNNGDLIQNGPWRLVGDGDIDGDVDLNGILKSGNVRIEDGKVYVGAGDAIVIDGATTEIRVGGMVIDPGDHNGMITMPNDAQMLAFGDGLELYSAAGGSFRKAIKITSTGVQIIGDISANLPEATNLTGLQWVGYQGGRLVRVPQNVGGPMGGPLAWPFPPSTVSSEFGPRDSPGAGGSTDHQGIDLAPGEGTPIPAAGGGVVTLAGVNGGFGNCVIIDHGNGLRTLYGHMQNTPSVSVGQNVNAGQTIGLVGNTGVSFGAHLHFEVHVNGVPVNPRSKLP